MFKLFSSEQGKTQDPGPKRQVSEMISNVVAVMSIDPKIKYKHIKVRKILYKILLTCHDLINHIKPKTGLNKSETVIMKNGIHPEASVKNLSLREL